MKKAIKMLSVILALLMCMTVVLAACDNDDDPDGVQVIISRPEANIEVGEELSLTATASDGSSVTWSSSNNAVATVSNSGLVVGVSVGTATITATAGEASATCEVTVRAAGAKVDKLPKTYASDGKNYTLNDYLDMSPSNWNELDYSDNNDTAILGYIGSAFFEYDYQFAEGKKFNDDGSINFDGIQNGFTTKYSAATALEDVTAEYAEDWGLTADQVTEGGYIWKITLRKDLAWNDGTHIYADDFVYSMQEQLNPKFQLLRADTYYNNVVKIHNAKNYLYQGKTELVALDSKGIAASAIGEDFKVTVDQQKYTVYLDVVNFWGAHNLEDLYAIDGIIEMDGGIYVPISEDTVILDDSSDEYESSEMTTKEVYEYLCSMGDQYVAHYCYVPLGTTYPVLSFDKVGLFSTSDYELVIVVDNPLSFLKEDGSLSWTAPYYLSSLPLVKEDLYEACKREPTGGSSLWTTTYNTTLATTASWGPYMLESFQNGVEFTLGRNEYWYGYALEDNKGQYVTDKIAYRIIGDESAAQTAFWSGQIDGLTIDPTLAADYRNSSYAVYSPGSGTFAIQVYGGLNTLKNSGKNNGVLAIKDFRMALSLGFDRQSFAQDLFTAEQPCLGLIGPAYLYDVENNLAYRDSEQGKAAILRAYGFTQNDQGKWTDGTRVYTDIDEASEACTGYNLTLAKQKLQDAWTELNNNKEKYGYDPDKDITIVYARLSTATKYERRYAWTQQWLETLLEGTPFEGKIKLELSALQESTWSDEFKAGNTQMVNLGGFTGNPFNPFNIIGDHINEGSLSFHTYFEATDELTLELPAGDYECAGESVTLTYRDWYYNLNGSRTEVDPENYHNWSEGFAPTEVRLEILARLEEYAISQFMSLPALSEYSASLTSAQWHYASKEYNTMMGFGGIQYTQYDYTDEEWAAFVQEQGGDLRNFYKN